MKIKGLLGMGLILGLAGAMSGCGSDSSPAPTVVSQDTAITPAQVTAAPSGSAPGSIAVAATTPVTATAPLQTGATKAVTAISIPPSTVITPPAGVTFSTTAPPVITISTPADNATVAAAGLPKVTNASGTAFTVASSSGAVDISISGASSFTLSAPATVIIPINADLTNPVMVFSVKPTGVTTQLSGTYSVDPNGNKIVTVTTKDFCWFIVNPKQIVPTGSTGGSTSINF